MSASEPPGDKPARKRMLPSVSDVVQQLAALYPRAEPSVVFKVAREVCAEELNRVKQGQESAPIASIVERASQRLAPILGMAAPVMPASAFAAPAPAPQPAPPPHASTAPTATVAPSDSVFEETTGALDLRWDKGGAEPLHDPMAPTLHGSPADAFDVAPPPPGTHPPVFDDLPTAPPPGEDIGMGEQTLSELSRQAEGVDLGSMIPHDAPPQRTVPFHDVTERMESEPFPPPHEPPRFGATRTPTSREWSSVAEEDEAAKPKSRALAYILAAAVALGAGFAAYTYFGIGKTNQGPFPDVPHRTRRTPSATIAGNATPAPKTEPTKAAIPAKAEPTRVINVKAEPTRPPAIVIKSEPTRAPAVIIVPTAAPTAAPAPAPTIAARPTPALRTSSAPAPTARMTLAPTPAPRIATAPTPIPVPVKVSPPPVSATTTTASASSGKGRAAPMPTKDWAGKAPVFTLHFSSYKDRASADKEAAQLGKKYGKPGHGVEVDLGEKGTWYRVVVGEFATADEARAFRDELLAQNTKGVGFVYRLEGK